MTLKEVVEQHLTATSADGMITYRGKDASWVTRWGGAHCVTWTLIDSNDPTLPQDGWILEDEW